MLDPAKWIFNAAASLVQPIFNAGRNQAQLRIAKAQQQEALLSFQQTLLNAGAEVNNALAKCQSARSKVDLRQKQVASLETAVESTQLLMRHGKDDVPRSADRTANPAVGTTVANQRPFLGDSSYRRSLPCPGRRP